MCCLAFVMLSLVHTRTRGREHAGGPAPRSAGLLVLQVAALLVVASPAARADPASAPLLVDPAFAQAAEELEGVRMDDHLIYGHLVSVLYATDNQVPGQVVGSDSPGHSALWTGLYLGAESFRYALARDKRDMTTNPEQRTTWQREMDAAMARILVMVEALHRDINIARNWKASGPYSPAFDGEAGLLFRFTWPEDVPRWLLDPDSTGDQIFLIPWDGGKKYWGYCHISRDNYDGVVFGLLAAFDLVGPDDPALQVQIRDDILAMSNYLLRHGWWVIEPQYRRDDPAPFANPLFVYTPSARLQMVQAARHVARVAGTLADQARWEAVWAEERAGALPELTTEYEYEIGGGPHDSYFKFNLLHLTFYDYAAYEPDPAMRESLKAPFAIVDATTADDINAFFETIIYALTGERERLDLAVCHLRDWIRYRHDWYVEIINSTRCGVDIECIPEDEIDYYQPTSAGTMAWSIPGSSEKMRAVKPLPIVERIRPHGEGFLWERSPYQLDGVLWPRAWRTSGFDYLLPYWMLRYYTEVAPPQLAPLPAYPGPRSGTAPDCLCHVEKTTVAGGGTITVGVGTGNFGFNAQVLDDIAVKGNLLFDDKASSVRVKSQDVSSVVVAADGRAVIQGTATVNDEPGHAFTVTVVDSGNPGAGADRIEVSVDSGYTASGILTSGNIQVHESERSCWQEGSELSPEILSQWLVLFGSEELRFLLE